MNKKLCMYFVATLCLVGCHQSPKKDALLSPEIGNTVRIAYRCWLADKHNQPGRLIDESVQPFAFTVGTHQVITGLDQEIRHMHIGQHKRLVISPDRAYGKAGYGTRIPPQATLIFDVTLLAIQRIAKPRSESH